MQRNREPIYLGLVKWAVTCVNCPCSCSLFLPSTSPQLMHISSHSQLNLGDALWPKINNNFKTLCIYATNATRSGHRSTQSQTSPPPPSLLLNPSPCPPFWHGSIVINHFRAPRCRRMTHASGQHWVLGLGLGLCPGATLGQQQQQQQVPSTLLLLFPSPSLHPQLVALFALFGGHKLFCCRGFNKLESVHK